MTEQCFVKKGSDPPACAAHDAQLQQHQSSERLETYRYGDFTFLMCPVSGQVVDDSENRK
jgi:hypothetical protein